MIDADCAEEAGVAEWGLAAEPVAWAPAWLGLVWLGAEPSS